MPTATNPETGEKIELVGDQWVPVVSQGQARTAGAVPGVAITPEQIQAIAQGQQITPNQRMLDPNVNYQPVQQREPPQGVMETLLRSGRMGALGMGAGMARLSGILPQGQVDPMMAIEETKQNIPQGITRTLGEIGGEIAGFPYGGWGKSLIQRMITNIGTGATAGAISAAGKGEDVLNSALVGAGFAGGIGALTEAGQALARKLINAKAGKFSSQNIDELVKLGEQHGVRVFADDVSDNILLKKMSVTAENIPVVGTVSGRKAQNIEQRIAARKMGERLAGGVDDFGEAIQGQLSRQLERVSKKSKALYDEAAKPLDNFGVIPKTNFRSQIQKELQEEIEKGSRANSDLVKTLQSFLDAPDGNFSRLREQRTDLGQEISLYYKGENVNIGATGVERLQRAKNALESDIDGFVRQTGNQDAIRKFDLANQFYQEKKLPFKNSKLAKFVKDDEPEKIMAFLRGNANEFGRKSRGELLYKNITPEGRQIVKAAFVNDAFEKANQGQAFSANKFALELEKAQKVTEVFFKGRDAKELDGLVRLMRATGRAGQIAENPPTGARLIIPGAIAGAATDLGTTVTAVGGFGLASKYLLTSAHGRNLLSGLNRTTENTRGFERLLQRINMFLTRSAITTSQNDQ